MITQTPRVMRNPNEGVALSFDLFPYPPILWILFGDGILLISVAEEFPGWK
jgi:hypothetical protein